MVKDLCLACSKCLVNVYLLIDWIRIIFSNKKTQECRMLFFLNLLYFSVIAISVSSYLLPLPFPPPCHPASTSQLSLLLQSYWHCLRLFSWCWSQPFESIPPSSHLPYTHCRMTFQECKYSSNGPSGYWKISFSKHYWWHIPQSLFPFLLKEPFVVVVVVEINVSQQRRKNGFHSLTKRNKP